jgi:hypothetical protein
VAIVVVEGCDGSGKTTLIERARAGQRERYFCIVRASRYPPDLKTSFQYLQWIKHQRDFDLILDRIHFISDRVYGPVLRNEDLFKELPITFGIESASVIIYARPPAEKIRENVSKDFQMVGVAQNIDTLIERYDEHMKILKQKGKKVIPYDYTQDDPVTFWRHIWSEIGATK